jgi:hypothetical protein
LNSISLETCGVASPRQAAQLRKLSGDKTRLLTCPSFLPQTTPNKTIQFYLIHIRANEMEDDDLAQVIPDISSPQACRSTTY